VTHAPPVVGPLSVAVTVTVSDSVSVPVIVIVPVGSVVGSPVGSTVDSTELTESDELDPSATPSHAGSSSSVFASPHGE
jgi:hypothetical protein